MGYSIHQNSIVGGIVYADNTVSYAPLGGSLEANTSEVTTQIAFRSSDGTFSYAGVYVSQNDISTASTVRLRVGGASKNIVVSCTGSTTGLFEDITHSDTISAGNLVNWMITAPSVSGSHTITIKNIFFLAIEVVLL